MEARRDPERSKGADLEDRRGAGRPSGGVAYLGDRGAEVDAGARPGTTSQDAERIRQLEAENRELRRANAILRSASAFFAADTRPPVPLICEYIDSRREGFGACAGSVRR